MTITDRRGRTVSGTNSAAEPSDPNPGLAVKTPCRVATTANITLSGLQTIDGVTVAAGDRVLVKDQTNGVENGIYVASSGNWTRAVDWDGAHEIVQGTTVFVAAGSSNGAKTFQITTANPIVIGTTSVAIDAVTIPLTHDLAALEALSGTGIARRTGTDAWSVGTTVSVAEGGTGGTDAGTARAGISAAYLAAMSSVNLVLNGGMTVAQELGTTTATLTNNASKYILDMAQAMYNHGAATAVVTSQQLAAASFPSALPGFIFGHQIKATTAITSPASGDFALHRYKIPGSRFAKLGFGASGAANMAVAFQMYSTASGTAFVRLGNSALNRLYYHEITVAAGWNFYAFAVTGDTSGTWLTGASQVGMIIEIFVSGKETTPQSSLDAWGATAKVQTTNSTNLLGSNNNLTIVTGLYVAPGSQLPASQDMPYLVRPFREELEACKAYLQKSYEYSDAPGANTSVGLLSATNATGVTSVSTRNFILGGHLAEMASAPALTIYSKTGTSGKIAGYSSGTEYTVSSVANTSSKTIGTYIVTSTTPTVDEPTAFHFLADSRI